MLIIRLFACGKSLLLFTYKKQQVFTHTLYTAHRLDSNKHHTINNLLINIQILKLYTNKARANNNYHIKEDQNFNFY